MHWAEPIPDRFWGPERLNPAAFAELVERLDARAEVDAIVRALAGANEVVDVGGGTGFLTRAIAEHGTRVIVIEPNAEQRARAAAGLDIRDGRAEQLPLADGTVDAALATWVLQYCEDPLRAIDELARVARHRVVIVQAAPGNDLVEVYNREAQIAGEPRAHHGYLLHHASERLAAAGFSVAVERVAIPVHVTDPRAMADILSRLHFPDHPRRMEMIAATEPLIMQRMADRGAINDDGALLVATRGGA